VFAEEPLLTDDQQDALIAATDDVDVARRASAYSGLSGTTAKTSFSQEEIAELDHDVMIDLLPGLATAAEELAKFLFPDDSNKRSVVWKEIRTPGSRHSKLFKNRLAAVDVHKSSFGSQEYISPSIVLRALLGGQRLQGISSAPWRPDDIIYKVNLIQMTRHLLDTPIDATELRQESFDALESLVTHFPRAIAGPEHDLEAVHMCLATQTQLAIARLHAFSSDHDFDPLQVVYDTFYDIDVEGDAVYRYSDALHMMDLPQEERTALTDTINDVANDLRSAFEQGSDFTLSGALGSLRARHSWEGYLERVLQYYQHRRAQLSQRIDAAGGVAHIVESLSDEVQRRRDGEAAEAKRQSLGHTSATPNKGFGGSAIAALKAREKRLSGQAAPALTPAPTAQMMDPVLQQADDPPAMLADGWTGQDDDELDQPTAQQTAQSTLAHLSDFHKMQKQRKGKQRAWTDRQPGAQRISFDESQPSQSMSDEDAELHVPSRGSAPAPYHVDPARASKKRDYANVDDDHDNNDFQPFDPTQDEGFEQDLRDPAAADERRRKAPGHRQPRAAESSSFPAPSALSSPADVPSPPKRPRKNPGASIPSVPPVDPDGDLARGSLPFIDIKVLARQNNVRTSEARTPRARRPWTSAEESHLIDLIKEECDDRISYALLKKLDETRGGVLAGRTAEDLRFKARNIKSTILWYVFSPILGAPWRGSFERNPAC